MAEDASTVHNIFLLDAPATKTREIVVACTSAASVITVHARGFLARALRRRRRLAILKLQEAGLRMLHQLRELRADMLREMFKATSLVPPHAERELDTFGAPVPQASPSRYEILNGR